MTLAFNIKRHNSELLEVPFLRATFPNNVTRKQFAGKYIVKKTEKCVIDEVTVIILQ